METDFVIFSILAIDCQPIMQWKEPDFDLYDSASVMRHALWKEYEPTRRLAATEWHPTFLAISERMSGERN